MRSQRAKLREATKSIGAIRWRGPTKGPSAVSGGPIMLLTAAPSEILVGHIRFEEEQACIAHLLSLLSRLSHP